MSSATFYLFFNSYSVLVFQGNLICKITIVLIEEDAIMIWFEVCYISRRETNVYFSSFDGQFKLSPQIIDDVSSRHLHTTITATGQRYRAIGKHWVWWYENHCYQNSPYNSNQLQVAYNINDYFRQYFFLSILIFSSNSRYLARFLITER